MMIRNLKREIPQSAIMLTILLFGCFWMSVEGQQYRCSNPNRKNGYCVSVYDCPSLFAVLSSNQVSDSQRRFIKESQCTTGYGRQPFVCCTPDTDFVNVVTTPRTTNIIPSDGKANILPTPPRCGKPSLSDRIYNGNDTALDEYPWMVLLEYITKNGDRTLSCGGSLINQRYVLTAGHCVKGQVEVEIGTLDRIRLGEYDLSKEIDCILKDCNNKVIELGIEEVITHPQYDPTNENRNHDIALIRMSADVTYTDFIHPACLPLAENRQNVNQGDALTVSGWGRTLNARQSEVKQHLVVKVTSQDECVAKFASKRVNLIPAQLCAGGEFAKDSCDGDSGGPVMRQQPDKRWFLEGIVSFGYRCGLEGWPAVYTRVGSYVDWIQSALKP